MNKEQKKLLRQLGYYELSRRSYMDYLEFVHSGRYFHMAHTKYLSERLQDIADGKQKHLIVEMPPRSGKLISDDTPVYTPTGWRAHGDLKVGDYVYHPSGVPIMVLGKNGKDKADWEVTFTSGEKISCHGNHEWEIYDRATSKKRVVETRWFRRKTKFNEVNPILTKEGRCKYQLPNISALENEEKELPIDPYVLGVWLGDGTASKPCITYDKKDYAMIREMESRGYPISVTHLHKSTGVPTTYFSGTRHKPGRLTKELRDNNLKNNKHIPDVFLKSSIKQRLDLLAGLVDSDGHCDVNSRIRYSTTNEKIRDGVYELCNSLGFRPYITEHEPKLSTSNIQGRKKFYQIGFNPTISIPNKIKRKRPKRLIKQRRVGIIDVKYNPVGKIGNCIQVDSRDGLYLVGKKLMPTHNSITITETFPSYYIGRNPDKRVITAAYSEGLARKFGRLNRNKLMEFGGNIFGVSLSRDNGTATNWGIDNGVGGMIATGVGGSITGEGADCIRNFSLIDTEVGRIRVDDLHKMKCKPMVLSYNHNTGDVEFKEAQVTRRVKTNEVTTISTVSGREITSTKEHNHFDFERGYREAHLFRPGDKLTIQTVEVEQALQSMWEKERWSWDILSRLLPISTQGDRSIRMQFMQKSLRNPYVRIQKEIKKWLSTFLLRLRMQKLSQLIQNFTPLRDMWKRNKKRQNVLFEGVSTSIQKYKKTKKNVRGLSHGVSERGFKKTDVFKGMFQRNGKQNVQIQNKKFDRSKGISRYSPKNIRKRWSSLFCLWDSREENGNVERNKTFKLSSSSQRREYSEQLNKKFNNCLSQLPYNSSSIEGEEIQSVTTERVDEYVYDIQVEGNHNFFANGMLVHNCMIIDDPIKNNEEAQSQTMRDKVWDEWETTLSTRLHKGASVIVVMTRWHEDDFVGRLLERSPYNWERIRMPAIAEDEDDLLGREVGTSLAPELGYDEDWAELKKKEVGSKTWASLYQQRPSASEGNIFNRNWWQYYESPPRFFDEQVISWDLTFKDNKDNDYVVGQVWGRKGADYYLIDQVRDKMDFPTTVTAVRNLSNKYPRAMAKLIEDKANGPAVIATLKREVNGIIPVNPQGSKVARAQAVTPVIESGNVFLPKHKEFSYDLIEEAAAFPNGKHDDQVDSASQALSRLANKRQAGISSVNIW